ncbi:TcpE family conjugal transfer membrane protein [Rhizohabitans arisaemae]|uniref:TcpE family conjugal transfer membrane protein n=1 Tax=Rhizohabitans arisaemae TaxID=2720610 RepID=UPI0024B2764E|nr:TcpE family conjugal transfer membrane protein [Rhizohabitans arisaemae]
MDLPTYTNIWRIEKRLYKLYDLRLPVPLPMVWIGVFIGVLAPWSLLLYLIGLPFDAPWHVVYLVPPGVVTWLATRPVIESKRLTELLQSQLRYMGEPRTWCRLAPVEEPSEIVLTARVWRDPQRVALGSAPELVLDRVADEAPPRALPEPATAPDPVPERPAARRRPAPRPRERALPAERVPEAPPRPEPVRASTPPAQGSALPAERIRGGVPRISAEALGKLRRHMAADPPGESGRRDAPKTADTAAVEPRPVPSAEARPEAERERLSADRLRAEVARAEAGLAAEPVGRHAKGPAEPPPDALVAPHDLGEPAQEADPAAPPVPVPSSRHSRSEAPAVEVALDEEGTGSDASGTESGEQAEPARPRPSRVPEVAVPETVDHPREQDPPVPARPVRPSRPDVLLVSAKRSEPEDEPVWVPEPVAQPQDRRVPQVGDPGEADAVEPVHAEPQVRPPAPRPRREAPAVVPPRPRHPESPAPAGGRTPGRARPGQGAVSISMSNQPPPSRSGDARSGAVPAVPLPGPSREPDPARVEPRVRRVESVVRRADQPGGWRRLAQVVIGGAGRGDGQGAEEARVRTEFTGSRRVVVLGCTGGAGQTTTALMLGHSLAHHRDDRILAVDANVGDQTLTSRIKPESPETLGSLLRGLEGISGYMSMRAYTNLTKSGLEVIAGGEGGSNLDDQDFDRAVRVLDRHYKLIVVDPAAAVAARALPYADQLVLVAPASEDAPDAVAMTYEWLDGHGCAELRRRSVMVVNGVSKRSISDVEQAEMVARGRCRAIVRVPWDDALAPGKEPRVELGYLRMPARRAYLALAGVVTSGFKATSVTEQELTR